MTLSKDDKKIIATIDAKVQQIVRESTTSEGLDEAIINLISEHMEDAQYITESLEPEDVMPLCEEHHGFFRFMGVYEDMTYGFDQDEFEAAMATVN